jgi:hypothetical protein
MAGVQITQERLSAATRASTINLSELARMAGSHFANRGGCLCDL